MTDLFEAMGLASFGMRAQGTRLRVISENMANANTTATTPGGDPYQRQLVTFESLMNRDTNMREVRVGDIIKDNAAFRLKYDPTHPAAGEDGYLKLPNVNILVEMVDLREAQRSYEANLGIVDMTRSLVVRTIDLLRA